MLCALVKWWITSKTRILVFDICLKVFFLTYYMNFVIHPKSSRGSTIFFLKGLFEDSLIAASFYPHFLPHSRSEAAASLLSLTSLQCLLMEVPPVAQP